ncbi:uncharacterized protein LOC134286403 [Aedes albopictus]|uniref:Endonuclease/exonuclease/phosphatase domain-containing protein n=1 Tax=Aedes albopictus TaxID=7160 RepID=A0ABM1XVI0_AEDAL
MEAPDPSNSVEPCRQRQHSRPGPVVETVERGFHRASLGKYPCVSIASRSDLSSAPSTEPSPPGRTLHDIMESSHPSNSVEPCRQCQHSRPGHVVDTEEPGFHRSGNLRIYYQNVRGLRTKIEDFFLTVSELDYDVIVLTETWLDDRVFSSQLFGADYSVFRTDRSAHNSNKSRGGGVLIAVSSHLNCSLDPAPVSDRLEQVWVKVILPANNVSIGVFYLPPDRKNDLDVIHRHIDSIAAVHNNLSDNDLVLQFGDYNLSHVHWSADIDNQLSVDLHRSRLCPSSSALLDGFCFHGLFQVNTVVNSSNSTLDLVLVNDAVLQNISLSEAGVALTALDNHHPAIEVQVSCPIPIARDTLLDYTGYNFRKADFESLNAELMQVNWSQLELMGDIDEAFGFFTNSVLQAVTTHVPPRRPPSKPPWSNGRLRLLKRRRSSALRYYCNHRSQQAKLDLNRTTREYRSYNAFLYSRYKFRTEQSLRTNPKRFWSFVNSKRNEDGLPTSMYLDEVTANCAADKCELFAAQFNRAFNDFVAGPAQVELALQDTPRDAFSYDMFVVSEQDHPNILWTTGSSILAASDLPGNPTAFSWHTRNSPLLLV